MVLRFREYLHFGVADLVGHRSQKEKSMSVQLPNKPTAPNPATASLLQGGHHRRGVGERRSHTAI